MPLAWSNGSAGGNTDTFAVAPPLVQPEALFLRCRQQEGHPSRTGHRRARGRRLSSRHRAGRDDQRVDAKAGVRGAGRLAGGLGKFGHAGVTGPGREDAVGCGAPGVHRHQQF